MGMVEIYDSIHFKVSRSSKLEGLCSCRGIVSWRSSLERRVEFQEFLQPSKKPEGPIFIGDFCFRLSLDLSDGTTKKRIQKLKRAKYISARESLKKYEKDIINFQANF